MSFISQGGEESLKFKQSNGATFSKADMSEGLKSCVGIMFLFSLCPSVWKNKEQWEKEASFSLFKVPA